MNFVCVFRCLAVFLCLISAGISSTPTAMAAGPCLDLFMIRYDDYLRAKDAAPRQKKFKLNTRFVLCVQLGQNAYVAIDDASPKGDAKRLFPNAVSHGPSHDKAVMLNQGVTCFGAEQTSGAGTPFPLSHRRDEGVGPGKISAYAAQRLEDIPSITDFAIPGATFGLQATCQPIMKGFLSYAVEE